MGNFSSIVEQVRKLDLEEQEELQFLLQRLLAEARRSDISDNFKTGRAEESTAKYSSSIKDLKKGL
jgi:hypothetical protein